MDVLANATLFISVAISLVLGIVIFFRGLREVASVLFCLISLLSAVWGAGLVGFHLGLTPILGVDWLKITHFAGISIPFFFFVFTMFFPRKTHPLGLLLLPTLLYLFNVFLVVGTDSVAAPDGYGYGFGGKYHIGEYYILYTLSAIFFAFLGSAFLVSKLRRAQSRDEKYQILYVLFGMAFSSTLAFVLNLIFPYFGIFNYTWLGPVTTLVFVGGVFAAILRYKFLNIRIVFTEIFIGVIIISLFSEFVLIEGIYEFLLKSLTFILVLIFSFLLIRSINKEIKSKERIEKLAKDLQAANKRLRKISELKTEFVSIATHQLRSPLTAIRGYVSMILEGSYGPLDEKMRVPLQRIFNSTGTLTQVVQDFLDVSRIEQGDIKYDLKTFSFEDLVKEVVNERMIDIERSGLDFSFEVEANDVEQSSYLVHGDRSKIKQVVANLLDNALKYTKVGFIKVRLSYDAHDVTFSITDSGVGIEKKSLNTLFQKFERAEGADEVNVHGTGLGLYIARKIVEAHQGKVLVDSKGVGTGATFTVRLKRRQFNGAGG